MEAKKVVNRVALEHVLTLSLLFEGVREVVGGGEGWNSFFERGACLTFYLGGVGIYVEEGCLL